MHHVNRDQRLLHLDLKVRYRIDNFKNKYFKAST